MIFEERISIQASPEKIFSLYKDVPKWSTWDPEIKESSLKGDFKLGGKGILKPRSGPKNSFIVTEVSENKSFTVKVKLPLCDIDFEHEIILTSTCTEVIHRIVFTGLLAPVFGRLVGKKIAKEQIRTMQALKGAATK